MESYLEINGHRTWVSDSGSDRPAVLLLHGGLVSSETSWADIPARLADRFRVVMFDRRGHGRTADTDAPFHYRDMADETAAVIQTLGLGSVHAVGYSDGANLLMHLALQRPELLRSMVLISGNYHYNALHPEVGPLLARMTRNENFAAGFGARSPDGRDHWPIVVAKGIKMGVEEEPTFDTADLTSIRIPTLVVAGDDDMFPLSHTVSMFEALPNAQLAIIPGTSHAVIAESTRLVAQLINRFLESPDRPKTLLAIRRPSQ